MPDFKQIFEKIKEIFEKLSLVQKILTGSILVVVLVALIFIGSFSSKKNLVALGVNLEVKDFAAITTKLADTGHYFETSDAHTIYIKPPQKNEILMILAQENLLPKGIPGYELFDIDNWSETQFEKDIKKQRALMGEISRTLETLRSIKKANVLISFPMDELFEEKVLPVTAAVQLHYSAGYERLKRKEIEGMETLVARAVPGLFKENISISGPGGELINNFDDESDRSQRQLKDVNAKLKIQEKERLKVLSDITRSLEEFYSLGLYGARFDVIRLDIKLRWDEEEIEKSEVAPVVMTPDDPKTPYSERLVQDSLEVSSKVVKESFEGNGFTPEGPAGTEPNIPPGYKDRDYQKAKYTKSENIKNNEFNKTHRKIKKQVWEYESVNLAVIIDGKWERLNENNNGTGYDRRYISVGEEELRSMSDLLKKAIGYKIARGDQISVKHLQKDRSKQFEAEDIQFRAQKFRRKLLLGAMIGLLVIALGVVIFHAVRREIERRKRLREEELTAQQAIMREAALRAIEEEGVEVEMSLEERARKEMLENAINLARERPEDVAHLLRTWLADDE